jgi:hypothetical protein
MDPLFGLQVDHGPLDIRAEETVWHLHFLAILGIRFYDISTSCAKPRLIIWSFIILIKLSPIARRMNHD